VLAADGGELVVGDVDDVAAVEVMYLDQGCGGAAVAMREAVRALVPVALEDA